MKELFLLIPWWIYLTFFAGVAMLLYSMPHFPTLRARNVPWGQNHNLPLHSFPQSLPISARDHLEREQLTAQEVVDLIFETARDPKRERWIDEHTIQFVYPIILDEVSVPSRMKVWARITFMRNSSEILLCHVPDLSLVTCEWLGLVAHGFAIRKWDVRIAVCKRQPDPEELGVTIESGFD